MVLCHWCKQEKPLKINVLIIFWLIFTWNLVIRVWWIWIKRVGLFPHTIHVFWWLIWRGGIVPQPHTVNHCVIWGAGTCRSLSFKYFGAELNLRAIADSCLYRKGITEVWLPVGSSTCQRSKVRVHQLRRSPGDLLEGTSPLNSRVLQRGHCAAVVIIVFGGKRP